MNFYSAIRRPSPLGRTKPGRTELSFTAPVVDGGQPGLSTPEELRLGAAISAYCTAFMAMAEQMALDVAELHVEGELVREYQETEGVRLTEIRLQPHAGLRTGIGFDKVHDMYRRAAGLAQARSPGLRALGEVLRLRVEPGFSQAR